MSRWRGARLTKRDKGANWVFVTAEQRSQARCPDRDSCCESWLLGRDADHAAGPPARRCPVLSAGLGEQWTAN